MENRCRNEEMSFEDHLVAMLHGIASNLESLSKSLDERRKVFEDVAAGVGLMIEKADELLEKLSKM